MTGASACFVLLVATSTGGGGASWSATAVGNGQPVLPDTIYEEFCPDDPPGSRP